MEDYERLMLQVGKAAKILDLKGDFPRAVKVLQGVLDDPAVDSCAPIKLETLVFLTDIHLVLDQSEEARRYLKEAKALDLGSVEPDLVDYSLERLQDLELSLG